MNQLSKDFAEIYENWQLMPYSWITLLSIIFMMIGGYWITRLLLRKALYRRTFSKISQEQWRPILQEARLLHVLSLLTPLMILGLAVRYVRAVLPQDRNLIILDALPYVIQASGILLFFLSIDRVIAILGTIYRSTKASKQRPIKSYVLFVRWFLWANAAIVMVSFVMGQSPWTILTGLGAASAFLGLIFRNTLLSFAAGIQLALNDVVDVGDWIESPETGANGDVIGMTFHAVQVQNWDKTIISIPTYKLVDQSFKNWKGMRQFGGRRFKRSILVDPTSLRRATELFLDKIQQFEILDRPSLKNTENAKLTNLDYFEAHLWQRMKDDVRVNNNGTMMVRQLAPLPTGALPIEVYCFINGTEWINFERIQAEMYSSFIVAAQDFDLQIFTVKLNADHIRVPDTRASKSGSSQQRGMASIDDHGYEPS